MSEKHGQATIIKTKAGVLDGHSCQLRVVVKEGKRNNKARLFCAQYGDEGG